MLLNKKVLRPIKIFLYYRISRLVFKFLTFYFIVFKPKRSITCYSGIDGGGAQLQRNLSVASMCHYYGIEFIFTPITEIDYYPSSSSKEDWILKWNKLLNLSSVYEISNNYNFKVRGLFLSLYSVPFKSDTLAINNAHVFADIFIHEYDNLIKNKKIFIVPQNEQINKLKVYNNLTVIHLRKPNFNSGHPIYLLEKAREISSDRFDRTIDVLKLESNFRTNNIKVFLASKDEDTKELMNKYPNFDFDSLTNAFEAIYIMSKAEVLVIAHSSMSYLAALFNKNKVYYYKDFWHSPKIEWRSID